MPRVGFGPTTYVFGLKKTVQALGLAATLSSLNSVIDTGRVLNTLVSVALLSGGFKSWPIDRLCIFVFE